MLKKVYDVKVIGVGLAALYAISLVIFLRFAGIADLPFRTYFYIVLFAVLFIGSLAVISLQEWCRKVIVTVNGFMFFVLWCGISPGLTWSPWRIF